jgi:hypothetical protein
MQIPAGPQALTLVWLTNALRISGTIRQANVNAFEVEALGDDQGITGQLARLSLSYDRHEAGAPRSLIAKFPATDAAARHTFRGHYLREVRFYEELAPKVKLRTPRCYYSALDMQAGDAETIAFVLLLEDLAPARSGDWVAGCTIEQAELAIRQIAEFHATWWDSPELAKMTWLPQPSMASFAQSQERYRRQWRPFLIKMAGRIPDELLALGERVGEQYISIMQRFHGRPQTVVHNDYQLGNLFLDASESSTSLVVIDWQTLTIGLGVFDVACFLGGNISSQERRAKEMELLKLYHTILMDNDVENYSFEQCFDHYRLCMLRLLIRYVLVVGGDFLTAEQEEMFCSAIVPRYVAAVLDLNADELLTGSILAIPN